MKKILYTILVLLIISFLLLLYSRFIGVNGLKTNEIIINTNIQESYNGLKIIHFSDIHYKKIITEKRVKNLISEINKNNPDIILFTGDLFDKDYKIKNQDINFLIKQLKKLKANYGTYAILGDHDKSKLETIKNIYIQSNITLLQDEYTIIYNKKNEKILIGGFLPNLKKEPNTTIISDYLKSTNDIIYQIILTHEPDNIPKIQKELPSTSLILAGHSLNGSINIPIIKQLLLPTGAKKYSKLHTTIGQTNIYISNGIGVDYLNFRLFNTPSINLYRLKKSN